jgi:predicted membrane channel-forming protein YqfA (hemolysin III family)
MTVILYIVLGVAAVLAMSSAIIAAAPYVAMFLVIGIVMYFITKD